RRPDGAGFADALDAQRVQRRRRNGVAQQQVAYERQVRGAGHGVIAERAGLQLPIWRVNDLFQERLAQSLAKPADDLPLDQHRVEQFAAIVDADQTPQLNAASIGVDFDQSYVRPKAIR